MQNTLTPSQETQVKHILTAWVTRMKDLGELKDFTEAKAGFTAFECRELEQWAADEITRARKDAKIEMFNQIWDNSAGKSEDVLEVATRVFRELRDIKKILTTPEEEAT